MAFNYLAEITTTSELLPQLATPLEIDRHINVYYIKLFKPTKKTWWNRLGGYYDLAETNRVEVYFKGWLQRAINLQDVLNYDGLYYVDSQKQILYFNVYKHPWKYADWETELAMRQGFLYTVRDSKNPSNLFLDNNKLEVRLEKPSFSQKLSDPIHSAEKYTTFNISLFNNDGFFDLNDGSKYFNGPAYLYKSEVEKPTYDDFIMFRSGYVENINVDSKKVSFSCAELYRSLDQNVCKKISADDYPQITELNANGKDLPVIYGTVELELIKLTDTPHEESDPLPEQYIVAEYVENVAKVFNKDDEEISFTRNGNIITALDAKYCIATGYSNNKIGEIIVDLIDRLTGIHYIPTFWDTIETDLYKNNSPRINFLIKNGTVKTAITEAQKSDMVFFIQKNDSRFTLRTWGQDYKTLNLISDDPRYYTIITQNPVKKSDEAQKYYFSECEVTYSRNERTGKTGAQFIYNGQQFKLEAKYHKLKSYSFETRLTNMDDARALCLKLSSRYNYIHDTIEVGIGKNTIEYNLLDKVNLSMQINDRSFSRQTEWIIKGMDVAQDKLTLEAVKVT